MLESYIRTGDGTDYVEVDNVREALGIKEDENIFRAIEKLREERDNLKDNLRITENALKTVKKERDNLRITENALKTVKKERDELKEKCDKLKARANAAYGTSCGYSGDKEPAFLCNVISYSWELSPIEARSLMDGPSYRVNNDTIRVELELTPTANYKGAFDLEDLKRYIQDYGREKKLSVIESVDYQNTNAARAKLTYLYKQVLGKEKLDRDLSTHEVMKAILDAVKKLRDAQFASDQCLRSVYMHVYEGTGYKVSDLYAAPDKIAEWIITRYDSTKTLGHMETVCNINDFIDDLCDKYNVVQPIRSQTTRERIEYIFSALTDYRNMADSNFTKAEDFRKEKRAIEDSLAELRAKVREIYRSVFCDCRWEDGYSHCSALNDINEEYKRVKVFFKEKNDELKEAKEQYSRYRLAVGSLLDIPKETRDDINAIERSFTFSKKKYESLKEFRNNVCEIFDIPSSMADSYILKEIHDIVDRYDELEDFRADICGALDIEGMLGTPRQNDKYILEQVEKMKDNKPTVFRNDVAVAIGMTPKDSNPDIINRVMHIGEYCDKLARLRSNICTALCLGGETSDEDILERIRKTRECHDKLCKDYTELHDDYIASQKQLKGFTKRCDSLEDLRRDLWELRRNAIEDLKSRGFFFRPEENETLPEIYDKLLKRYDDYFSRYKEQYRLRQQWHVRWESENERANGVQKALDREREKCRVKDISLETAKKQYKKVCNNLETAECALNGMKSKIRELQKENAGLKKDVASLTGDTSVDLYEEEGDE